MKPIQTITLLGLLIAGLAGNSAQAADAKPIRTLIVGGGTHHDFERWFNQADTATLKASGAKVDYTENLESVLPAIKQLDVLYLSNNKPMTNAVLRNAIFDFADAGGGLLLVHPALWYNWNDWPEYNRTLVSGGSRAHDRYGEFEVTVDDTSHPIMAGVPKTFKISDELYYAQKDPQGPAIQVLATGKNLTNGKTYPVVWITQHPKARIVCVTLGHDGKAHEHAAYKSILQNSLKWAATKP
jgi:type 1 glutamine amidotransferase